MRREYIEKQKKEHSRRVLGVLPIHYPREVLWALNVVPVEIWGPPGPPAGQGAVPIQTYICPIVRNAVAFLEAGKADVVDGLLVPHTCDSLQGFATLVPDWTQWSKPVFRFYHPRGPHRPEALTYLREEIASLVGAVGKAFGLTWNEDKLTEAVALYEEVERLIALLFKKRLHFPGSDRELYSVIRRGEFMRPEDHLPALKTLVSKLSLERVRDDIPVMVTGYVPEPMEFFDALNEAGAVVVADDYAAVGRRLPHSHDGGVHHSRGMDAVIGRYLSLPPCPTRTLNPYVRAGHLLQKVRESGARGVIIHEVKFCEPELFDVPSLRKACEDQGVPVLFLETELETELPARHVTMIEAFMEVIRKNSVGGKAA